MNNFMRILRDPNPDLSGGAATEPEANEPDGLLPKDVLPAAPAPTAEPQMPRDKEGWEKLAADNPAQWIKWTQPRMDQAVREAREAKEKLAQAEQQRKNLEAELANFKKGTPAIPVPNDPNRPFSKENMPQTDTQWDQLWIENPSLAADLRHFKNEQDKVFQDQQVKLRQEYVKTRQDSVKTLAERHPDMYVAEKDESGNIKMDGNGKPVLKINPETGLPIPDLESEKFRVFNEVYSEDPDGFDRAKYGTRSAMVEMERRLQERGKQQIQGQQGQQGQGAAPVPDQRGVLPGGVTPPVTGKVLFASDEEERHVERAIQRGVWKSKEEYCSMRDKKSTGFVEENRTPKFG